MSENIDRSLIQNLVREVISEVIADKMPKEPERIQSQPPSNTGKPIVEEVTINNDDELNQFVKYLLALSKNEATWVAVEKGIWKFRLNRQISTDDNKANPGASRKTKQVEKGLLSENLITAFFKEGFNHIVMGKSVVFTPLGKEKARQLGILIEREKR